MTKKRVPEIRWTGSVGDPPYSKSFHLAINGRGEGDVHCGFAFTLIQLASPIVGVYLTCEDLGITKLRLDGTSVSAPEVIRQAVAVLKYNAKIKIQRLQELVDAPMGDAR